MAVRGAPPQAVAGVARVLFEVRLPPRKEVLVAGGRSDGRGRIGDPPGSRSRFLQRAVVVAARSFRIWLGGGPGGPVGSGASVLPCLATRSLPLGCLRSMSRCWRECSSSLVRTRPERPSSGVFGVTGLRNLWTTSALGFGVTGLTGERAEAPEQPLTLPAPGIVQGVYRQPE